MPNGWSGGFVYPRQELEKLLNSCGSSDVVGQIIRLGANPRRESVSAAHLRGLLDKFQGDAVPVEKQYGHLYVVHFSETDYERWVMISETSPLFDGFRRCHTDFVRKHRPRR